MHFASVRAVGSNVWVSVNWKATCTDMYGMSSYPLPHSLFPPPSPSFPPKASALSARDCYYIAQVH